MSNENLYGKKWAHIFASGTKPHGLTFMEFSDIRGKMPIIYFIYFIHFITIQGHFFFKR